MEQNVKQPSIKKEDDNDCENIVTQKWESNEIKQEANACIERTGEQLPEHPIDIGPTTIGQDEGNAAIETQEPQNSLLQASSMAEDLQEKGRQTSDTISSTQAIAPTNIQAGQSFNQLLSELRTMTDTCQGMINKLTEEVKSLRNEVRQLITLPTPESELNLLPPLPLPTLAKFQEFDQKLAVDNDLRLNLKNFLVRVGGSDLSAYTRLALRRIISDEASTNITWCGTNDKPSFQSFATFNVIKDIGYLRFSYATDVDINKICQQHFLHAKDRINKKLKNKNKKGNGNDTM